MIKVERVAVQPGDIPLLLRYTGDGRKKPAVIIVHGGGRGFHKDWSMKALPMDGSPLLRAYVDMPHHGDRGDPSSMLRDWLRDPVGGVIAPIIIQMRKDLSRVVDYLQGREDVDPDRIGACGWSSGGTAVILAVPRDKRIRAAATVSAAQTPRHMLRPEHRGIKQWPLQTQPSPEEVEWLTREEDAETWADHFYPTSMLLIHGEDDLQVPPESTRRLYNWLVPHYQPDPSRLRLVTYPGAGHHPVPEMARDIEEWFTEELPGAGPPGRMPRHYRRSPGGSLPQ